MTRPTVTTIGDLAREGGNHFAVLVEEKAEWGPHVVHYLKLNQRPANVSETPSKWVLLLDEETLGIVYLVYEFKHSSPNWLYLYFKNDRML